MLISISMDRNCSICSKLYRRFGIIRYNELAFSSHLYHSKGHQVNLSIPCSKLCAVYFAVLKCATPHNIIQSYPILMNLLLSSSPLSKKCPDQFYLSYQCIAMQCVRDKVRCDATIWTPPPESSHMHQQYWTIMTLPFLTLRRNILQTRTHIYSHLQITPYAYYSFLQYDIYMTVTTRLLKIIRMTYYNTPHRILNITMSLPFLIYRLSQIKLKLLW